jgi:exodeoxyribonuclease VII large subunit
MEMRVQRGRLRVERAERRLLDPRGLLGRSRARVHEARRRLAVAIRARSRIERKRLGASLERIGRRDPRLLCAEDLARLQELRARLRALARVLFRRQQSRLSQQAARLHALSPLSVLGRGYAIALHERSGRALLSARDARPGDVVRLRLHAGELKTRVQSEEEG